MKVPKPTNHGQLLADVFTKEETMTEVSTLWLDQLYATAHGPHGLPQEWNMLEESLRDDLRAFANEPDFRPEKIHVLLDYWQCAMLEGVEEVAAWYRIEVTKLLAQPSDEAQGPEDASSKRVGGD